MIFLNKTKNIIKKQSKVHHGEEPFIKGDTTIQEKIDIKLDGHTTYGGSP